MPDTPLPPRPAPGADEADARDAERRFALFGAGGFGREVAWSMGAGAGRRPPVCFVDDRTVAVPGADDPDAGPPVLALEAFRERFPGVPVAVAVGAPAVRRAIAERLDALGVPVATLVHDRVRLAPSVRVAAGAVVCDGTTTTVDIDIGRHVHVNLGCTIGHDVEVGDFATLSPGVHVSGYVRIGDGVFVGTGAVIVNGAAGRPLTLGAGSVIGAGACVIGDTEPGALYAGVPAKPVRGRAG